MEQDSVQVRIAVCDDDRADRRELVELIKVYLDQNDHLAAVDEYDSGEELLAAGTEQYGIVFLDIYMTGTDGMETASRRYTKAEVRAMVERQKALYGWEFLFLGANMDAIAAAEDIGIRRDRAVKYVQDSVGMELNSRVVSDTLCDMRMNRPVTASWKADIEADEQARG